jgi:glucosamine--fructose-6-phosphate aminotransferase (isomerizing)
MAKYAFETLARLPVEAEVASEYRYRQPVMGENELFIAISQSGETADTLAALQKAKASGGKVMAISNVTGSSIVREVGENNALYTYAGPEIAVASTKAYVTQVELLIMIAAALGTLRGTISSCRMQELFTALHDLPEKARKTLKLETHVRQIVRRLKNCDHVFFIGRGMDYALSMEAALKLKEVSYLFSEAYAAGELKHGPIALLQPKRLVIASITQPQMLDKMLANLEEVRARGAEVLAVCPEKMMQRVKLHADELIVIPDTEDILAPLLAMIPLQLFAYYMALERGCDVDQPRNLAKSVTVE